mgnify:CR=1 FL=1
MENILYGIGAILLGVISFIYSKKFKQVSEGVFYIDMSIYFFSILGVIVGLYIIIREAVIYFR